MRAPADTVLRQSRHLARIAILIAGLLLALGLLRVPLLAGFVFVFVVVALPFRGLPLRVAGGVLAVLLTRDWPAPVSLVIATEAQAQQWLAFDRAFVSGALVAETLWILWCVVRDRIAQRKPTGSRARAL